MKKSFFLSIIIIFCAILCIDNLYNIKLIKKNKNEIDEAIKTISINNFTEVNINDITNFKWEKVYFFDPYISKRNILEIMGIDFNGIKQYYTEGVMQIFFINEDKVVCYLCGSGNDNGYYIDGDIGNNDYVCIYNKENMKFIYDEKLSEQLGFSCFLRQSK